MILDKVLDWSNKNDDVRLIIQTGSLVRSDNTSDKFSDYDLEIFVNNISYFSSNNDWIKEISKSWIILPLINDTGDPTKLVIFEGGEKVDFTLNKIDNFKHLETTISESDMFNRGFKVILDKDSLASILHYPAQKSNSTKPPTEKEFIALVEEFFFEIYHVAKYLRREDLWSVKFRDWSTKELLLKMLEWSEKSKHEWNYDTWYLGQKMKKWVDPDIYQEIYDIFAHFEANDSWEKMENTVILFRKLAKITANEMNFHYPQEVDDNITKYINGLK